MATFCELSTQTKYTLCKLHEGLVLLVKFVLNNYKKENVIEKDLETVLSGIIKSNLVKFKKTGLYKQENYRKNFGDIDPSNPKTFVVKPQICIDSLDVSSLCLLLITPTNTETKTKAFIFEATQKVTRCCYHCKHEELPNHKYKRCNGCKKECNMIHIITFCKMVKFFRDCFAHDSKTVYESLTSEKACLKEFPSCKNWEELWNFMWEITSDCMNVIKDEDEEIEENEKLISEDKFKDFEMEMRWAKKSENVHLLLPKLETQIAHYYKVILGQAEIQDLHRNVESIRKGIFNKVTFLF